MNEITIVFTFVRDIIMNEKEEIVRVERRGPAYFLSKVFAWERFPHKLLTGQELEVEIKVIPGQGEFGRIRDFGISQSLPEIDTNNLLISTLCREWDLSTLNHFRGRLFLDIQGFVRDLSGGFGKKQKWLEIKKIGSCLFCLKGTEEELGYLPVDFLEEQKIQRCLVLTKGKDASLIKKKRAY